MFTGTNQRLARGAGRRKGLVLAYFFSCSKGIGRLTSTVTLALSVGFMVYSQERLGFTGCQGSPGG